MAPLSPVRARITAIAIFTPLSVIPASGQAADVDFLSVGARARVGEKWVLGKVVLEPFREYDVVATLLLPWQYYTASGWGIGTRLMGSAGILEGANKTALVVTAIPLLAIGSEDGRLSLDLGAGLALTASIVSPSRLLAAPARGPDVRYQRAAV